MRVTPGRLPARVMVAPNSPRARAKASTAPAPIAGPTIGSVTREKVNHRVAPSVAAASSTRRSAPSSAPSTAMTRNGRATNVWATTTAALVKGRLNPVSCAMGAPRRPERPKSSSKARPPTTGGSTSGTRTSTRTTRYRRCPGISASETSHHASGTPMTRHTSVAATAHERESQRACPTSGCPTISGNSAHGTRRTRARMGSTSSASATSAKGVSAAGGRRLTPVMSC